jgi:hypothetical protein
MPAEKEAEILGLIKSHYLDFGPTLASEKLLERDGLRVSKEKLRQLMMKAGIWKGKPRRKVKAHCRRERRSRRGELLQGDASPHAWFEERGPECDLIALIDDATGLAFARFVESESTESYMRVFREYVELYGCPETFYPDKHAIFRVPTCKGKTQKVESTQFARVLKELSVELVCAHSPQAKGRVERLFGTFQDRLLKELRLAGANNMEEGNRFLKEYLPIYNQRFAKEAANPKDAHRPIPAGVDLNRVFTWREKRRLSKSLDFSFHGQLFQAVDCQTPRRMMNKSVTVFSGLNGEMWVELGEQRLEIKRFEEIPAGPKVLDSKQLNAFLNRKKPMTVKERLRKKIGVLT